MGDHHLLPYNESHCLSKCLWVFFFFSGKIGKFFSEIKVKASQWSHGKVYFFLQALTARKLNCLLTKIQISFVVDITLLLLLFISYSVISNFLQPDGLHAAHAPGFPSLSPGVCSNSCPLSWWNHTTISSSATCPCPQSFPASGSFPMSWLFTSGGQIIGASASASVLPMNIQCWFSLGLIGLISLLSKGLLRVFFNTTDQKHQFLSAQLSLWFDSHIHTWLLKKP